MTTERTTLAKLAERVQIEVGTDVRKAWGQQDEWQQTANGYRITLRYQGRRMSLDFWQGTGIKDEPTAAGVLECLLLDVVEEGTGFNNWCDEYGLDSDSRKALRTYKTCVRQTAKLRKLLGDDFDTFRDAEI